MLETVSNNVMNLMQVPQVITRLRGLSYAKLSFLISHFFSCNEHQNYNTENISFLHVAMPSHMLVPGATINSLIEMKI